MTLMDMHFLLQEAQYLTRTKETLLLCMRWIFKAQLVHMCVAS